MRDGISVHCLCGCHWLDIKKAWGIGIEPDPDRPTRAQLPTAPPEPEPDTEALEIWRAALCIDDPLAALGRRYLTEHRGLSAAAWPPSLRFAPEATYPRTGVRMPALVAAVARPTDRKVIACQLTFLRAIDGAKAPLSQPRWTFGKLGSGAVRLAPAGDVLGLAEGTETALAAMMLTGAPTWAAVGGHRLPSVTVPEAVREIHLFADNDEPGRLAARKAAERHTAAGRRVMLRYPPDSFGDWADVARATGKEVAA